MSAVMAEPAAVDDVPVTRRPKKKLIVIGLAVLALVGALGAGTVVFLKQRAAHAAAATDEEAASSEATPAAGAAAKGVPFTWRSTRSSSTSPTGRPIATRRSASPSSSRAA